MKYLRTFPEKCNGCNACMSACSLLYFKEDNPEKSAIKVTETEKKSWALNTCNQCLACLPECPTLALTVNKQGVVMLNKNLCINCLACVAVCPSDSMMTWKGGLTPFKCIACGTCAKECPTAALKIEVEEK